MKTTISRNDFVALVNSQMKKIPECNGMRLSTFDPLDWSSLSLEGDTPASDAARATCEEAVRGLVDRLLEENELHDV
jgi:hypothetical protein